MICSVRFPIVIMYNVTYCSSCGAGPQSGTYCSACGKMLNP